MQPVTDGEPPATVRVRVPAKINLALRVGPLGADGYHPLATVFQAVSLFDDVTVTEAEPGVVETIVRGEGGESIASDDNLASRAARLVMQRFGVNGGVRIEVRKQIPIAGGMAGGSADGAAALLGCAHLWDLDASPDDLLDLASELGSDVPFALLGGNAIGRGRGTELFPVITRGAFHWVLALAGAGLSTPAVFRRFDEQTDGAPTPEPVAVANGVIEALTTGDAAALGASLRNDLQAPALDLRPELGEVLDAGRTAGALGGIVSGSGPTCAFLAPSENAAIELANTLRCHPTVRAIRRAVGPVPGARVLT